MVFNERKAIEIEICNLKEQTRMDYDLYFESRKIRNEQIAVLLDRLRELDERDRRDNSGSIDIKVDIVENKSEHTAPNTIDEWVECKNSRVNSDADTKVDSKNDTKQENTTSTNIIDNNSPSLMEQLHAKEKLDNVKSNIIKENVRGRTSKSPSTERVASLVMSYLKENGESRIGDLQKFVEGELDRCWRNFSSVMKEAKKKDGRIVGSKRGYYDWVE